MSEATNYTFGIEEELFLVHPTTRGAVSQVPRRFLEACRERLGSAVAHEMLQTQVELVSPVYAEPAAALQNQRELRRGLAALAAEFGLRIAAAGTHPLAAWQEQKHTEKPRYERLIDDFQIVGRRNLLCGLHVHVAVPTGVDRVALMNRLMGTLPLFLALSTSSPFWTRRRTGLLSYRQAAYDEWPRTGIPDAFADEAEYRRFAELLVHCGAMRDAGSLWWAIRPAERYPTLELRICDACTRAEDAVAIATLYRCTVRAHVRDPALGAARGPLTRRVIDENRWRAKRYGVHATFVDEAAGAAVTFGDALATLLGQVAEDAAALGVEDSLQGVREIVARGTSAHAQLALYRQRRDAGATRVEALRDVVDALVAETLL